MGEPVTFGKYTLLERIGAGGMAEIWRASLKGVDDFQKILVVKKILPKFAGNRQFITMFVQEAKVTSGLHHANVVQIYELGEENGEYFIAMEYVQGCDLLKVLTKAARSRRPLPPELCVYLVTEVCKGLGYAHSATDIHGQPLNIVHLDVSPSNVLLSWDGEVKLTDFGVARASVEGKPSPKDDRLKGKLGYMSPEQVTGKTIDSRSDLFSIGILLYELITLKRLFLGKTDTETLHNIRNADAEPRLKRHPEIPEPIADIIRKALTRNVETRYQTAYEIEEALSQYLFERRMRMTPQRLSGYLSDLFSDGADGVAFKRSHSHPSFTPSGSRPSISKPSAGRPLVEPPAAPKGPSGAQSRLDIQVSRFDESSVPADLNDLADTRVTAQNNIRFDPPAKSAAGSSLEESVFRFKSAESGVFGPVDFQNLQQLLSARSVAPTELVQVNDEPWRPFAEVSKLFGQIEPQLTADVPSDETGLFRTVEGTRLLCRFAASKATGRFRLVRREYRKEVYFRRGKPVHISSNRKSELFGSVLVAEGLVTEPQLSEAIKHAGATGGPMGAALVKLGYLKQGELFRLLELQFREKFISIFDWDDAAYEFRHGTEPPPNAVPFMLDPFPSIVEGARRHVTLATLDAHFEGQANKTIRLESDPAFDASKLKLAPREHRVRMAVENRPTTLSELLSTHGKSPEQRETALFVLFLLHQTEHIRIG
ncbi:MAG: serine/threonine protein kinase [Myxococcota bacterium]|jgi:serine/threonine protein kinase